MKLSLRSFELPLARPFGIARGVRRHVRSLVVELEQGGVIGYGAATANSYYGATIENMTAALEAARRQIESRDLDDPAVFWRALHPMLAENPFAHCALDTAAYDLWGKLHRSPVWKLWGLDVDDCPATSFTIGLDTIDVMIEKLLPVADWPIIKIKLGTADDLAMVRRLREHTGAVFRVDANCGWTADETIRNAEALAALGVEFIEQPLPAENWEAMRRVYRESALPLVADESCRLDVDVDHCKGHFHGINIKLTKCGGLTPARRMIARAKQLGLMVMIGCMTESSLGISAAAQLAPAVDYADLDGALLLAEDIASGVTIEQGRVLFPRENGCGVRLV